jgi:hypothetical protein
MTRFNVEQVPGHLRGVSDDELTRLIDTGYDPEDFAMPVWDTVKVKPPLPPARMGMSQGPVRSSLVMDALVRNLKKKWGRMR